MVSATKASGRDPAMVNDDLPYILTVRDLARLLRISPKQARALPIPRIQGLGPRTIRYMREDVIEFVQNNRSRRGAKNTQAATNRPKPDRQLSESGDTNG